MSSHKIKLIDLTDHLEEAGLIIIHPIYWRYINGIPTPILTVAKAKSPTSQGEALCIHRTAMLQ